MNHSVTERFQVYYWRERNEEVDFILERNRKLIAIEVKTGRRGENKGIQVFSKMFQTQKAIMVGTSGISIEEFLRLNPAELF